MLLLALTAIAGIAAALICPFSTSGGTVARVNCYSCPADQCKIVTSFSIAKVPDAEVSCIWGAGQKKGNDRRWYYDPTNECFIRHNRLKARACRRLADLDDCMVIATGPGAAAAAGDGVAATAGPGGAAAAAGPGGTAEAPDKRPPCKPPQGKQPD
ncbi:hypothetical protein PENFLA_c018G05681 [Penicillium flavigenum]|uniref:Secreted protein n=1 Tax=Penicillium flavigenum TaxID=254877 RepID=A0A1V6T098_9EURO|nr:hypothetical protein PENFLA_c018G05681 [Penicillium flavigenum]